MEPNHPTRDTSVTPTRVVPSLAIMEADTGALDDCWNRIGVTGNATCPELPKVVHCRNCAVYAAAGARLLDRPMPIGYRRDWTEHFSREKKRATTGWHSAVIFRLATEWLALPTRVFREITEPKPVHSLPHRRNGVVTGLINVRGELLICVSLEQLLEIKPPSREDAFNNSPKRLVISDWQSSLLAFQVDEIQGIHRYQPDELKPSPATVAHSEINFTTGLIEYRNRWVGCLDADLLFSTLNRSLS